MRISNGEDAARCPAVEDHSEGNLREKTVQVFSMLRLIGKSLIADLARENFRAAPCCIRLSINNW